MSIATIGILLLTSTYLYNKSSITPVQNPNIGPIELNISAALGLKEALLDIQQEYERNHPTVKIIYNLASAGVLESQIEHGAQVDIFISAANKQVDMLAKKNLIEVSSRKNLVSNELVLIVPKDSSLGLTNFNDLAKSSVTHYGLGEPETVPAGQYGMEVMKHLGIWEELKSKAVLTKDVRTILSYVETGNVEAGIVFSTVAAISDKIMIIATAPKNFHEPIVFPGVVLTNSKNPKIAQDFLDYLTSPPAIKVFQKYGFQTVE